MLYPSFKELLNLRNRVANFYLSYIRHSKSISTGDHSSPFRGQGLDFDGVREYTPGDDIRNIDWRVTARIGKPYIKTFTEDRERNVILCIDMNESMRFGTRVTFKSVQAAYVASLIGWRANLNKDRVGACFFGSVDEGFRFFTPQRSRKSLWKILKLLSTPVSKYNNEHIDLEDTLEHLIASVNVNSLIFIISDFNNINEDIEIKLGKLKKKSDVVLIHVSDIADKILPSIGPILFSNDRDQKIFINTNSVDNSSAYSKEWQNNFDLLKKISLKLSIGIINITTDCDLYSELSKGLRKINTKKFKK